MTAFQPTLITAPEEAIVAALAEVPTVDVGARVLASTSRGRSSRPAGSAPTPPPRAATPTGAARADCSTRAGVTYMTLAPELDGALELIDLLHARGVVVSCGHSDATAAEAGAAFDRGARTVTHLFNAMRRSVTAIPASPAPRSRATTSSCR